MGKELSHPPSDGVSSLRFSRHSDHLLVSWDKTVRLYDAEANMPMGVFMHAGHVLDCCFHDYSSGFSAGGDNSVRRLACLVEMISWDATMVQFAVWSTPMLQDLLWVLWKDELLWSSSISLEYTLCKKYAFKCHRLTEDGTDIVYPVNAISFHPIYGTFATGGCDRFANFWDGANKRRSFQDPRYPCSIAALSFSRDGSLLAVASSYTYEEGDIPHESEAIFIRDVNEVEVKPRHETFRAQPQ